MSEHAEVAELADALGSGPSPSYIGWRFKSSLRHCCKVRGYGESRDPFSVGGRALQDERRRLEVVLLPGGKLAAARRSRLESSRCPCICEFPPTLFVFCEAQADRGRICSRSSTRRHAGFARRQAEDDCRLCALRRLHRVPVCWGRCGQPPGPMKRHRAWSTGHGRRCQIDRSSAGRYIGLRLACPRVGRSRGFASPWWSRSAGFGSCKAL